MEQEAQCSSPWIMRLELDQNEMASRNTLDLTHIVSRIMGNKIVKAYACAHSDINILDKVVLRIIFNQNTVKNMLSLRFLEEKLLDTLISGARDIGKVYMREVNGELRYNELTGGYAPIKQYVLDTEGTNLLDISTIPGVDPFRSFSNNVHEIIEVFGIETARVSLFEEFNEVFAEAPVNYHHMIMLVDTMTYLGKMMEANRFGMSKGENGVLAKSSFEETTKILFNAALSADFDDMRGVSANIMFGQKPPYGTGFVDLLVDDTRLPKSAIVEKPEPESILITEPENSCIDLLDVVW
jgi:DNA-directed RNA polymerase II subunit RPB1